MSKEKNLFTVGEDEKMTEEIICVAEDDELEKEAAIPVIVSPTPLQLPLDMGQPKGKEEESTDWRTSKHPKHFVIFLLNEIGRLPKPNSARGSKSMLEKALGQYKQLDSYISQALRSDYDDEVDVQKVDEIRKIVDSYKDEVQDALDGINMMTKQRHHMRRRRAEDEGEEGKLVKEATTPQFKGIQVQMSAFERAVVGAIINGAVSGGRNIEELYKEVKEKYDLTNREELAILQIMADFGYPIFKDRLMMGSKNEDSTRKDNFGEWQSQYYA
ncbi:MAG: hypothetical protein WC516_05575 [Patescibacteria group bacterium]|jgi:hypothetical protein